MNKKAKEPFIPGLEDMKPSERAAYLRDNACKVEQGKYFHEYDEEVLSAKKDEYTDGAIRLGDKEDEFAEVKADYTGKIKEMKLAQKSKLTAIRTKGEWKEGDTFMFDDQENGLMYTFDELGNEVGRRKLRPAEKQTSILTVARAVNQSI